MTAVEDGTGTARRRLGWAVLIAAVLAALALGAAAGFVAGRSGDPGEDSPEAGFARDMQTHHQQAVQMALLIRDKSDDPVLRAVAYDIITTQQQQAGQMYAWLQQWGLPQTGSRPMLAWMQAAAPSHAMPGMEASGTAPTSMPGMASAAELKRLETAQGRAAETLFLRMMIRHHAAGIRMAEAVQQRTQRPEVLSLARSIASSQTVEVAQLRELLSARTAS